MSGGWEPGDLALCIKQGPWIGNPSGRVKPGGPRAGEIIRVARVAPNPLGGVRLHFAEHPLEPCGLQTRWFVADRFVKITPGTDAEGFEEPRRIVEPTKGKVS